MHGSWTTELLTKGTSANMDIPDRGRLKYFDGRVRKQRSYRKKEKSEGENV